MTDADAAVREDGVAPEHVTTAGVFDGRQELGAVEFLVPEGMSFVRMSSLEIEGGWTVQVIEG